MTLMQRSRTLAFWGTALMFGLAAPAQAAGPAPVSKLNGAQLYTDYACNSCHGERGRNGLPGYARLAAQDPVYLMDQLTAFKTGKRAWGAAQTMVGIVAQIPDDELRAISAYLAQQSGK